nr:PREDICTED: flocculation protein FLO11-like [Bemisia tabaci]
MLRNFRICFALWSAILAADATATPAVAPSLQYPQLEQRHTGGTSLITDQGTPGPNFHDLTHQAPHPTWLDLPTSSAPQSNIQRIPNPVRNPKPPSQLYPQPSGPRLSTGHQVTNQSIPLIDIPTNNLPIHREEVEYNPQKSERPSFLSARTPTSLAPTSTSTTAESRTPQYTLPQINFNGGYSRQESILSGGSTPFPDQSFNTNSIRVTSSSSVYQQAPQSSGKTTHHVSSSPSSYVGDSDLSNYPRLPNQASEVGDAYSQATRHEFGDQPIHSGDTRVIGDQPIHSGDTRVNQLEKTSNRHNLQSLPRPGTDYGSSETHRQNFSNQFNRPGEMDSSVKKKSSPSQLTPASGNPQTRQRLQPRPHVGDAGLNRFGDQPTGSYPRISTAVPGFSSRRFNNQTRAEVDSQGGMYSQNGGKPLGVNLLSLYVVQSSPNPLNSIAAQPAFEENHSTSSTPTARIPSSSPIYFVSSTPGSSTTTTVAPSAYPQFSNSRQGSYSRSEIQRTTFADRSATYRQPQHSTAITATPASTYGRQRQGVNDLSQSPGAIFTTATPIVADKYPVSSYGGSRGYAAFNSLETTPVGKTGNRGRTKFSTPTSYGGSEYYPAGTPQPVNAQSYSAINRGEVKFASSIDTPTVHPRTSSARAFSRSSPDSPDVYPRPSDTVPPLGRSAIGSIESDHNSGGGRSWSDRSQSSHFGGTGPPSYPSAPITPSVIPPQSSEPSYPQSRPSYQQPSLFAAQYVPESVAPNTLPNSDAKNFPSPSYTTSQVFGSNLNSRPSVLHMPGPFILNPLSHETGAASLPSSMYATSTFAPVPIAPNSASNPSSQEFPSPSYFPSHVVGYESSTFRPSDSGFGSSTAAPSIQDYAHNPFLRHLIPSDDQSNGHASGSLQYRPSFVTSASPAQGKNDVFYQRSLAIIPAHGNSLIPGSEAARPTIECPHQFGYYRLGDQTHCSQYTNCANGIGYVQTCPEGLAFNEVTIRCDWPDEVSTCDAESFLGFTCPQPSGNNQDSDKPLNYPHPKEPTKYFSCQNGRPRLHTCPRPFDAATSLCVGAENEEQS